MSEELQQLILRTMECGMGDRDADGNFRRIFCDDDSLSTYDGRCQDCQCRATYNELQATISRLTAERDAIRAAMIEECAKAVEPSFSEPTCCDACHAMWRTSMEAASTIRALATPAVSDAERALK